jgi:hypothetical protein
MKQVKSVIGGGPVSFVVNYQNSLVVLPDYLKKHEEFDQFLAQHELQHFHIIFAEQDEVAAFIKELEEFTPWLEGFLKEQLAKHQAERQEEAKRNNEATTVVANTGKQRHISPEAYSNTEEIDYQRVALKDSLRFYSNFAIKLRDKTKSRYKEELDAYEIKRAKIEEEKTLLEKVKRIEKSRTHQDSVNREMFSSQIRKKAQLKHRQV